MGARGARLKVLRTADVKLAALTLALLTGCAARKPAAAQAHLVAPPQCVTLMAPLQLDANGQIDQKKKIPVKITCTEVAK